MLMRHTEEAPEAGQKEIFTSWALSILIVLLIIALFTSYIMQTRKIQAVHETVLSIFAGMSSVARSARDPPRCPPCFSLTNTLQAWSLASS